MTNSQKQHLLAFLGYYKDDVDGIWGDLSEEATRKFQEAYGLVSDGIFGKATEAKIREVIGSGAEPKSEAGGDWWDEIEYFDRSEYACKCGKCGGFPVEPQEKLVKAEDKVRKHFGVSVYNSSGVRCKTHNANVGGVSNSRHLSGKAVDFRVKGKTAAQTLAYVQTLPEIRYSYAIDNNYVHMDIY